MVVVVVIDGFLLYKLKKKLKTIESVFSYSLPLILEYCILSRLFRYTIKLVRSPKEEK